MVDVNMVWKIGIVLSAAAAGIAYTYLGKQPHDNPVEEAAEQVIKNETGIDVDLSPTSPEKKS